MNSDFLPDNIFFKIGISISFSFNPSAFFVGSFMALALALSEKVEIIQYTRVKVKHKVHWEDTAHSPVEKTDTLCMSRQ